MGKGLRWRRILKGDPPRTVIVPMDHGVTSGPIEGLEDMAQAVKRVQGGADAIVIHKGVLMALEGVLEPTCGVIVHLSASHSFSPQPNAKVLVSGVEEALRLGADGVSVHINLGDDMDREMLKDLGRITEEASKWGVPVLAMIYPRGKTVKDPFDPELIAHGARLGAELGADVVKVPYTGDPKSFSRVVQGCFVPVVIAGGPKVSSDKELLEMVVGAMQAGAAGISIGRNVFQHESPKRILGALRAIVHEGAGLKEALELLGG